MPGIFRHLMVTFALFLKKVKGNVMNYTREAIHAKAGHSFSHELKGQSTSSIESVKLITQLVISNSGKE